MFPLESIGLYFCWTPKLLPINKFARVTIFQLHYNLPPLCSYHVLPPCFIFKVNHLVDDLRKRLRNFNIYAPKGPNVRPLDMGKSDNQLILKVRTYHSDSIQTHECEAGGWWCYYSRAYLVSTISSAGYTILHLCRCIANHVEQSQWISKSHSWVLKNIGEWWRYYTGMERIVCSDVYRIAEIRKWDWTLVPSLSRQVRAFWPS